MLSPKARTGFLLLLSLSVVGCQPEDDRRQSPAQAPANVVVQTIVPQKIKLTTELAGRVSAFQVSEVRPQVNGIIQKRTFKEGSDVQAGEFLYIIDPATYEAARDSAEAALSRAEANVLPAKLKKDRFRELIKISAVSRQDYEDAEAAWKQAVAEVAVNKAAVRDARIRLGYTRVTAPISGRISSSLVTAGALVTANQASALTTVQQLDPVYVDVTQSSTELLELRRNLESGVLQHPDGTAEIRLLLEDGSAYPHTGTVQFTDVRVDATTGSVTLRAIFPNPEHILLPGMYVRAVLDEGVQDQAILLPHEALIRDAKGNASVYVVTPAQTTEVRPIQVGRSHAANWLVLEGLNAGERVIVEGLQKVRPGSPVHIADPEKLKTSTPKQDPRGV